ncbi:ATP-binding protein [Acetonema longum]|uniref:Putative cytoplasmic protein n=1 Tax=Acetonema longum DSM 6540 TaxID=1009370 RepID=F7NMQ3_9FIRM|nr:ATP-binding protein [Acetonema longum]EGO62681.1 putative cytoplasmic protein [Acetonema longum DSM 6540]
MSLLNLKQEYPGLLFGATPGFRLAKLEVLNWGTFDGQVWTFSPGGETSLLTGDVGSGKSTLVDALTTLLVAPRKVAYNKAADSSAKERSITSYVRGYFGQKKSAEGTGQPDSLRDMQHYSVLLATFQDSGLSQSVTLAQFFWYQDAQKPPARFYVVADKEMWITQDFSKFDKDVRELKKRLKNSGVRVFEDYTRYAEVFRRKFGIEQEQALDLFQQTISMKKVEALTEFVRANMLQVPNTEEEVEKLKNHFQDLNSAHEAVLKAKRQIELLHPIADQGKRCEQMDNRQNLMEKSLRALSPWFAEQTAALLTDEIARIEQDLILAAGAREQAEIKQREIEESIKKTERDIYANGGGALEALKAEIENLRQILDHIRKNWANYANCAGKLKLSMPKTVDDFISNRSKLPEIKSNEETLQGRLNADLQAAAGETARAEKETQTVAEELESLRSRRTSIPREYIEKRKQLCRDLKLEETELPFAGELLEVREEEAGWEGAIERLLHNFGLSMLVPEKHYPAVMRWVDQTMLGIRLVYYRVSETSQPVSGQPHPAAVSEKLNIKPNTSFGIWLTRELRQRFSHVCCEGREQFSRESLAITQAGQIKSKGNRHEKDDRYAIDDRRRYILGFSNQKKIEVLEANEQELKAEIRFYRDEIDNIRKQQKESQERLNAAVTMEGITGFADIDTRSKEKEIDEKEERRKRIEQGSDVLQELQHRLTELEEMKKTQEDVLKKAGKKETTLENRLGSLTQDKERADATAAETAPAMKEEEYPFLEKNKGTALQNKKVTLESRIALERDYRDWLEKERGILAREISQLRGKIIKAMSEYNNQYAEETREVDPSMESLPEYNRMLAQLESDGLPRFEKRFKQLLHENTINQIALFQAKLKQEQDTIKSRIEQINGSLSAIDYDEGRYIRLEHDETYDSDIKAFRVQLKACTEGALTGSSDDQYAETKFLQVKAIIERFRGRPGETESDARWTKKVIDVRNWFLFAASERWRETDEEYEHYTDSGGKSGGQKEKLAYTILAASLVYHFGLEGQDSRPQSFRFVVIDEAFLKSSDESARFGLELFKKLDLQLLIVTPLLKIPTIAHFIAHVGFVHHDDIRHRSMLRNISIEEYEQERKAREVARYVHRVV